MSSQSKSLFLSLTLLSAFFLLIPPYCNAATNAEITTRLEGLEKKLEEIQKQQVTLLEKTQELSEKVETVKVWARRG